MTTAIGSVAAATLTVTGVSLLALSAYVHGRRDGPGVAAFSVFVGLLGVGGAGGGLVAAVASVHVATLWIVRWAEVGAIAWFVFALGYTGWDGFVTRRSLAALLGLYLALLTPLVVDALLVDLGTGLVAALRIATDLYGLALTLLGATLVFETTYRHGVVSTGAGVALGTAAFLPWFLTLTAGFALRWAPSTVLVSLYAVGFLASGLLVYVAVFALDAFDGTAATHTYGRRAILAETDDLVVVVDADERVVELNEAACRRLGVEAGAVHGTELSTVLGEDTAALEVTHTVELATIDGLRQFDVDLIELSDSRDRPLGHFVSLRDVTRRRQREQGLDVLNRLLRHNLRNTLNVVEMHTALVADRLDDPELEGQLDETMAAIDELVALGDKARSIERTFGTQPLELSSVDVGDCVDSVAETVGNDFPEGDVRTDGADGAAVTTYEALVRLALENVVENALEHSDADTPRAEVRSTNDPDGVTITVEDNGPGIPETEAEVIEQGRETPTEHASSVGLWLVSWAVTTCGGTVAFGDGQTGGRVDLWIPDRSDGARAEGSGAVAPLDRAADGGDSPT